MIPWGKYKDFILLYMRAMFIYRITYIQCVNFLFLFFKLRPLEYFIASFKWF